MIPNGIGVVAIGRNEGERLVSCLASVKSTTDHIVYVDSGSTDGSIHAAQAIGAFVVALDLTKPFTAARARNEGFAALKALSPGVSFVQFVDGDCIVVKGWLDKALAFIEQRKDVAIVCGRRRERYPTATVYNQLCDLEWDTPVGEASACGGDALVRVTAFQEIGGFRSPLIAGEEPELCVRLREKGWKIWRLDAEMTGHDAAMRRFGQWWVRAVRCGHAYAEVFRLHRTSPFGIWKRETASAIVWGGLLPIVLCLGALIHPISLLGALVYFFQICRIALAWGATSSKSWKYAVFTVLGKFAEFQGVLTFHSRRLRRKSATLIEYK
ncbi:glycosyltransferase [Bradyrhizobium sp. McL0616]|uniref:glycosyltransferase n=1 Tax=Bradyrhizobium sp. McL0616 TaxID=3415674 RepID=UPI003CFBC132